MKKILRSAAVLLAAALIASFCAMTAFAEAAPEDTMSDAELEALLAMLEEQGTAVSGTDVSGADVSASDVIGIAAKPFGEYDLTEHSFREYGLSFLAPDFKLHGTVYSDAQQLSALLDDSARINALFDISYSGFTNYVYYGTTDDGSSMMAVTYTESNWSRFLGNFADLSPEDQLRIENGSDLIGVGDGSTAAFRVINGTPMLCQEHYDTAYMAKYYIIQAVVDGGLYEIYIQLTNPSDADMNTADQIINSLKIKGFNPQRYGVASTATTGWLIALVALLFIAVAFLAFFVIRFSMFAKASGSSFNIIGFDLPSAEDEEEYEDEYDDDDQSDED